MRRVLSGALACLVAVGGCQELSDAGPRGDTGAAFEVTIAALNLVGVGDVVWDVEVQNGADAVVWQRRLTSSGYGDGAGSASYVGPCDADPAVATNEVRVWVVGVYEAAISGANVGSFNATHDGVTGASMAFQNPTTPAAPLSVTVVCQEGVDTPVQLDVALMRPAQQGFFDMAVSFNDLFCSAKYDCCDDATGNGCALDGSEDIALLFDADGARATTHVLAFACTAGAAVGVTTELYMDALALDCTDPSGAGAFAPPDVVLDPAAGPGNACTAGALAACPAVLTGGAGADTYLYQFATYRGLEALTSGGVTAQKVYWNVALGVKPAISACRLRAWATADDAADDDDSVVDGTIAAGAVYPYVQWDVALAASCGSRQLTFGDANAPVRAAYTATSGAARPFAYGFGPDLPAGSFCDPACDALSSCISAVCVPPPPRTTACTGLPANAVWNTVSQVTQSWNGSAWLPTEVGVHDVNASATACRFVCAATHPIWTGSACVNTRVEACTGLVANAVWNTVSQITQTWDGASWLPTTVGAYNATASATECRFACDAGFVWNATTCEPEVVGPTASGGTVTDITYEGIAYRVHVFTTSGTFTVGGGTVNYLVVGGGAAGSGNGGNYTTGGGGAGAATIVNSASIGSGSFAVTVGAGGIGAQTTSSPRTGNPGSPSSFNGTTAAGGVGGQYGAGGASGNGYSGGGSSGGGGGAAGPGGAAGATGGASGPGIQVPLVAGVAGAAGGWFASGGTGYNGSYGTAAPGGAVANGPGAPSTGAGGSSQGFNLNIHGHNGGSGVVVIWYLR